jgi:ring-1,2-phenylacetyl-CoA epoxidase subunit PaaC
MKTDTMNAKEALFEYCLRLGDTALILGQRISEWCGHGPILEEDIALSNIALDQIGQARLLLNYAGEVEGKGRTEDTLAYHRDARQFRNLLIVEQPNGDFAVTIARQFLVSSYLFHLYSELKNSSDKMLAAFAAKSLKEVAYHVRHSADWMLRLGDGTDESNRRLQDGINDLWFFVDDMFAADEVEEFLGEKGVAPDLNVIRQKWEQTVFATMNQAKIQIPAAKGTLRTGSRMGNHTEHLGYILAEMQFLPRAYPDAQWK